MAINKKIVTNSAGGRQAPRKIGNGAAAPKPAGKASDTGDSVFFSRSEDKSAAAKSVPAARSVPAGKSGAAARGVSRVETGTSVLPMVNASPKRKAVTAKNGGRASSVSSRSGKTSIRQATSDSNVARAVTGSHTETSFRVVDSTGGGGGRKPKVALALKFALPVAGVVVLIFLLLSIFLMKKMAETISQEIIKSGVAQVSMLGSIGTEFINRSDDPDWPVKLGLTSQSEFDELKAKCPPKKNSAELSDMERTLYAAQNGALLRKFITSNLRTEKFQRTQTIVAYILSRKNKEKYGIVGKTPQFILARSELAADIPAGTGGELDIDDSSASWLPGGINLRSYSVGGDWFNLSDEDSFPCTVYAGVVKGIKFKGASRDVKVLAFVFPIYSESGTEQIGNAVIGIDAEEIVSSLSSVRTTLFVFAFVAILFAVFTCLYIGYDVTKPIGMLIADMGVVAGGNLEHKSRVASNDEIGQLANQFNSMTAKLQGAVQNEKKIAAVESELDMAREIQKKLLPDKLPKIRGFDIFATYHPAKEVGGDYYDFFPIDERHVGIMVADVSGKGVPGSMVMATTRTILRFIAVGNISSADTLKRTNSMVAADIKRGMFVTAFYMVLDVQSQTLLCSSAGHNPMVLIHADGNYELINPNGIALGFDKGRIFDRTIKEQPLSLRSGDRVVMYTDGVVEAMNLNNEEYTDERFYTFVQNHFTMDSESFVSALLDDLNKHKCSCDTRNKKAEQHDDITVVTFRVL